MQEGNGERTLILHIVDSSGPGGSEAVVAALACDEGETAFLAQVMVPESFGWLARKLGPSKTRLVPPSVEQTAFLDIKYVVAIRRQVRSSGCSVVHAHSFDAAVYACIATIGLPVKIVATAHGRKDVCRTGVRNRVKWLMLRRLSKLVVVSRDLLTLLTRSHPALAERAKVLPNGIDTIKFNPSLRNAHDRGRARHFRIGALGNVRPEKDYDTLIQAAQILISEGMAIQVQVAGDDRGSLADALRARARELCGERFAFVGFVDKPEHFLSSLDAYVLCSRSEGLPLSLLQAGGIGVPIVSTRCGGPEEIFGDGAGARMINVGDSKALATALRELIEFRDEAARLGRLAHEKVSSRFSEEKMLAEYREIYCSLQSSPP